MIVWLNFGPIISFLGIEEITTWADPTWVAKVQGQELPSKRKVGEFWVFQYDK